MTWKCKNCKSENPEYTDVCIRCRASKNFDPDEETKILPPVKVDSEKPGSTIKADTERGDTP